MTETPQPKKYHCPQCGHWLIYGAFVGWVQAHCPKCKKERRFEA